MKDDFSIAVFPVGERYVNKFNDFYLKNFPWNDIDIFCLTNLPKQIKKQENIKVIDIKKYDNRYNEDYKENYWWFDFNVKRYAVKEAFDFGYERVILFDVDHKIRGTKDKQLISSIFEGGAITGISSMPATPEEKCRLKEYNCEYNLFKNSETVNRLEDSGVFFDLSNEKFYEFYENWNKILKLGYYQKIRHPRGCLDEISVAAKLSNIDVLSSNMGRFFYSVADKWYLNND